MNASGVRSVTVKLEGVESSRLCTLVIVLDGSAPGLAIHTLFARGKTNAEALSGAFAKACAFAGDLSD